MWEITDIAMSALAFVKTQPPSVKPSRTSVAVLRRLYRPMDKAHPDQTVYFAIFAKYLMLYLCPRLGMHL
jgi:hypothetical protein